MDIKLNLVLAWFAASFISLIVSIGGYFYINQEVYTPPALSENFNLYAALPAQNGITSEYIFSSDGRAKIVESFFRKYKSPLYPYSETFVQTADKYNLDWRLLPSIAMQESNGGKRVINHSFNPFGFGIYGNKVVKFANWEEGIEKVGKTLKEEYVEKGYKTVEQIMVKYTPPSISKGGPWAIGVNSFMFELN